MKQPATDSGSGMTCEMAQRAIALAAMAHPEPPADPSAGFAPGEDDGEFSFPGASEWPALHGPERGSERAIVSEASAAPEATGALAEHLKNCRSCQAEMAATSAFFRTLAGDSGPEPSPTLLARARMQLDATLDSCERAGPLQRIAQYFSFTAGRLRAAPGLSSALLLLGVLAGGYGGYRAGHTAHADEQARLLLAPPPPEVPSVVADVSSIRQDPETGVVEVRYDRLVPDMLSGSVHDPSIRELLMAAAQNGTDVEVRHASLSLLSGPCPQGATCGELAGHGDATRHALLSALLSDKTSEVRREALLGLQPFIAEDMEVRDAVLQALMSDPSASVRREAVRMLQPVDADSSVRQVLHTVASRDGDPAIRLASTAALKTVPQVQ